MSLSGFSSISAALLGQGYGSSVPLARVQDARQKALTAARSPDVTTTTDNFSTCYSESTTTVTFNHCTMTDTSTGESISINGSASATATANSVHVTYDLTLAVVVNDSSGHGTVSFIGKADVTYTGTSGAGTINGYFDDELVANGTFSGTAVNLDVGERLTATNLTLNSTCMSDITNGSLEAKRVWNTRPAGFTATQLPNVGVKVTWTACGQFTFQTGVPSA
jgi:hypothetical protein